MQITEVKVTLRDEDKLKAFASITFDDAFVIRGLKVISGSKGYFVSMPSKKGKDGKYHDIAHPINNEMRKSLEESILQEYERLINSGEVPDTENGEENNRESPED
ncbi:MAG: septation regulator SpoVG [Fibrobacterota bacterium]